MVQLRWVGGGCGGGCFTIGNEGETGKVTSLASSVRAASPPPVPAHGLGSEGLGAVVETLGHKAVYPV